MNSIILRTASNYLLPMLILFSVFVLLRGHYEPGGGFVGGLVAAIAFVLHSFAHGLKETRRFLRIHPGVFIPIGLSLSLISAVVPMFAGQSLMTGLWFNEPVPVIGLIGSALFFELGVYFVVFGVTLSMLFTITESV
ncbi:monovalent cation/H+ antiporter subunit B [Pedobacter antarcticus 4BY]|uniref:Monovalent cation/H+ antiporter subunit B n=2 Tax=Pedobacter antarcticus TaxID=34086 RepID=A0A081PJZ2_9SPHI|nr:Na+/H+ antiporter subunit B [Pedobacter antarcticus]KEQ31015.1 monovalent cation/H+ antiporter subunit B [Pedobacter antarcticus 4BY]SFF20876.1 multisubunit sodium/proton antiporter, MrpB subunit (TC 2.A.63.1) [Pedobacter antarcticus]